MWGNHFLFVVKRQWWKVLLIYMLIMIFNINLGGVEKDVKIIFNEMAFLSWFVGSFIIFEWMQIGLKRLYDSMIRFKLLPGNKISLILADISFVCLVFGIEFVIFNYIYQTNTYNQYLYKNVGDFYSNLQNQPFMSIFYPYRISNMVRTILYILCLSSFNEYCILLEKRIDEKKFRFYEFIGFLFILIVLVFTPISLTIVIYGILIYYYVKECKYNWEHIEIGG